MSKSLQYRGIDFKYSSVFKSTQVYVFSLDKKKKIAKKLSQKSQFFTLWSNIPDRNKSSLTIVIYTVRLRTPWENHNDIYMSYGSVYD